MELYIDTANLDEISQAAALGVLDGVTTNPSLVAKEGVDFHSRLEEICKIVSGPVSAEVVSITHDDMIAEAEDLIPIKQHFPRDYQKILEWFPLADLELFRLEKYGAPKRDIWNIATPARG